MKSLCGGSIALMVAMACKPAALPLSQQEQEKVYTMDVNVHYLVCIKPADVACVAISESEKSQCPKCTEWKEVNLKTSKNLDVDPQAYSYDTGSKTPRANVFLSDATKKLFGTGLPKTEAGSPIKVGELYNHPEKYGWIELPPDQEKAGAIVVWPTMGGLVVEGKTERILVLHPSDKRKGELKTTDAKYLAPDAKPKFLLPKVYLEKAAAALEPRKP